MKLILLAAALVLLAACKETEYPHYVYPDDGSGGTGFTPFPVTPAATCSTNCSSSGACSSHGGVNCLAGADVDGSVICVDGWLESTVAYHCG